MTNMSTKEILKLFKTTITKSAEEACFPSQMRYKLNTPYGGTTATKNNVKLKSRYGAVLEYKNRN